MNGLDAWIVIILLGVVILLYAFMLPKTAPRKMVDEEVLDSVEGTLQQFVEEMEEGNKEFARMVGEMKQEHERKTSILLDRIEFLERKTTQLTEELAGKAAAGTKELHTAALPAAGNTDSSLGEIAQAQVQAQPQPHAQSQVQVQAPRSHPTVKSRYKEVFALYDSGKSIEYIARKLGTNKGEIQLIVQLARREEQADASK